MASLEFDESECWLSRIARGMLLWLNPSFSTIPLSTKHSLDNVQSIAEWAKAQLVQF